MPDHDQAQRLADAAAYALDCGYQVTAVAEAAVALRMVLDGHADLLIAAALDDLPQVEVATTVRPVVPRQRAVSGDVVPPEAIPSARRRPRRRLRGATRDAPGDH